MLQNQAFEIFTAKFQNMEKTLEFHFQIPKFKEGQQLVYAGMEEVAAISR